MLDCSNTPERIMAQEREMNWIFFNFYAILSLTLVLPKL
jgi:hypothetical protein